MSDESLEWELGIDADTSGGARLDDQLGRLESQLEQVNRQLLRVELGSRKAGRAHEEQEHHAKGLQGAFERLIERGLEPFLHKAKEIAEFEFIREGTEKLLELPEKLAEGVFELGEEMLRTAAKEERMGHALRNALGGKAAEEADGYIENIRKHTEFTKDAVESMLLDLSKSGYKGSGLSKAYEAAIDLASMSANKQEGAMRAISALERVRTTGKLEARALVPFGISEQQLLDEMGKETGMSSKSSTSETGAKVASQVQKAMEAGRVPIETELNSLYTLITKKTGKALGGAGADMEQDLEAKMTHLHELPELFYERLSHSRGYERVSDAVSKLLDGLDPESPRGKRIFGALETAFDHIADIMTSFDLAGAVEKGIDALDLFATELVDMVSVLPGETGRKASLLAAQMQARRTAKARENAREEAEAEAAAKIEATSSKAGAEIYRDASPAERVKAIAKGVYRAEDDETPWLVKGLKKSKGEFEGAGREAGEAVEKGTRDATRTHSPSEAFADIGRDLAAGIDKARPDFEAAGAGAGDAVQGGFGPESIAAMPMSGGRGMGTPTVVLNISPQIYVNGDNVNADEIAKKVVDLVTELAPGAIQSALEQIAMQGGPSS